MPPAAFPKLATRTQSGRQVVNGEALLQWQDEVTGAGRLWYCIDDDHRLIWLTGATPVHPNATE